MVSRTGARLVGGTRASATAAAPPYGGPVSDGYALFFEVGIALALIVALVLLIRQYRDRD